MQIVQERDLVRVIGQTMREVREARRLTLSAVAKGLGISYQQLHKYERGENRISASMLYRLAEILDMDVAEFFADAELLQPLDRRRRTACRPVHDDLRAELMRIRDPLVRHRLDDLLVCVGVLRAP